MTLGQAKTKARKLMDEYSLNGLPVPETSKSVADYTLKMNDLFDAAQKEAAQVKFIVRSVAFDADSAQTHPLPENYYKLRAVYSLQGGRKLPSGRYALTGQGGVELPAGRHVVEYCAYPATITSQTPDDHEFEVAPDACEALPYFVAASCLQHENQSLFAILYGMYQTRLINLSPVPPPPGQNIRQRFFGG